MGDLGAADAGMDASDARSDSPFTGGPSTCPAAALLCDGFEDPAISKTRWPYIAPSNILLEASRAARGNQSLHVFFAADQPPDGGTYLSAYVSHPQDLSTLSAVFARAFYYLPTMPAPPTLMNVMYLDSYDSASNTYPGMHLSVRGDGNVALGMLTPTSGSETVFESATPWPRDRWVCFEVELDFAGGLVSGARVWMDDVALTDIVPVGPFPIPPRNLEVGVEGYRNGLGGPIDLWVDEVVESTVRIGCAN